MPYANKEEQREYQRQWVANKRKKYLAMFGGRCAVCRSTLELEFDHCDPNEKISHRIWGWSHERIMGELAKCQLLCKVCHLEKTGLDYAAERQHGTNTMYTRWKCRCQPCRDAHADANAKYRKSL